MAWLTRLSWLLGGKDIEANIVIVGLSGSGKSTVMRQLKPHEVDMIPLAPTLPVAFHAEKFSYKTFTFIAFSLGEQDGFGNPWEDFYKDCHGIIYVVDSADRLALPSARSHLEKLLNHPNVMRRNIPLLFLANKTDVPSAMPPLQVSENMKVNKIKGKPCKTVGTNALTGEGFNEGLDWLAHQLRRTRQLRWSLSLEYEQHA